MFYSPISKTESSFAAVIDIAAKSIAVIVALSLLVGTTFNITFFVVTKPEWLFHLSVTDNITATFYSLPVVMVAAVGMAMYALMSRFEEVTPLPASRWRRFSSAFSPLLFVAIFMTIAISILPIFSFKVMFVLTLAGFAGVAFSVWTPLISMTRLARTLAQGCLATVTVLACIGVIAVAAAHRGGQSSQVETFDAGGNRSILIGNLVRILDGGVIQIGRAHV